MLCLVCCLHVQGLGHCCLTSVRNVNLLLLLFVVIVFVVVSPFVQICSLWRGGGNFKITFLRQAGSSNAGTSLSQTYSTVRLK